MAFYENYVKLCNLAGKSPSAVAVELKLGKPSVTRWKHGAVPRDTTILKIAGYFGVSVEELTQDTKKAPTPTTESERSRQIAARISEIVCQLYPETQESCLQYFESLLALQNAAQGRDIQARVETARPLSFPSRTLVPT